MKLKIRQLEGGFVPRYQTPGAAGMDLHAVADSILFQGQRALIRCGIAVEIPYGYEGQVRPRSGLALKQGLISVLGTIDSDYRGEIGVLLMNYSASCREVKAGDRIAQLVIARLERVELEFIEVLSATARGESGWGSTGS